MYGSNLRKSILKKGLMLIPFCQFRVTSLYEKLLSQTDDPRSEK